MSKWFSHGKWVHNVKNVTLQCVSFISEAVVTASSFPAFFRALVCCMCEKPIFVLQCRDKGAFTVLVDNYVKEEEGTGVVHQAPYFGAVSTIYVSVMFIFFLVHMAWLSSYCELAVVMKSSNPPICYLETLCSRALLHALVPLVCWSGDFRCLVLVTVVVCCALTTVSSKCHWS